jgi:hypothetical protein
MVNKPKRMPPNAGKGRGKGNLNKTTMAAKEFAEVMLNRPAYEKSLQQRLDEGKAPHMEILLHHYRSGKPKDTVRVEDAPATLQVIALRSRADIQLLNGAIDVDAEVGDGDDDES